MKRFFAFIVALGIMVGVTSFVVVPAPQATAPVTSVLSVSPVVSVTTFAHHYTDRQVRLCAFKRNDRWSHTEVFDTYKCVYRKIDPNDMGIAGYIGERESHFNAYAKNPDSTASGVYQFVRSTWASDYQIFHKRVRHWNLKPNVFNARSNIFIAAYVMKRWGCGAWSETC